MMPPHPTRRWDRGSSVPSSPPQREMWDGRRRWVFPASSTVFGHCPGAVRPRSLFCSSSPAWERRFPGAGEHGGGGGEAGAGFDGSNSTFHSLSRFNGRGDQSRDGVIHRDKPIPEEARRKQHCKLCYPRSPSPGEAVAESAPGAGRARFCDGHCPSLPKTG